MAAGRVSASSAEPRSASEAAADAATVGAVGSTIFIVKGAL